MLYRRREAAPPSSAESSSSAEVQEENPAGSAEACLSVVADSAAGGLPVADSALDSSTLVAAESKDKGGRVRVGWAEHATQQLIGETEPNLRQCAQKWLQEKSILHSTLRNSTDKKTKTVLCNCKACEDCDRQYCFRLRQPAPDASDESYFLVVEHKGTCTSKKDLLQRKLQLAREYALQHSPARAIKKMKDAGVPAQELPSMVQLKNQRPGVKKETDYSTDCLQQLKKFLAEPPDGLCIYHDKVVCEPKEVRIPFSVSGTHEVFQDCGLSAFLLDFTYKTNRDGLLLGCIGAAGLLSPARSLPSVRMIPGFFVLANSEDEAAHVVLLDLFFEHAKKWNMKLTDGFLDCKCLNAVLKWCRQTDQKLFLHRCLQHVKKNIRDESGKRDSVTGQPRLRNSELLSVILDFVQFSATLPCDIQFHTFWSSILTRMASAQATTDFKEPAMAAYLREHILDGKGMLHCNSNFPWGFPNALLSV